MDGSQTFTLTLDELVLFAQQGWHYPLTDDADTRRQVAQTATRIKDAEIDYSEPCRVLDGVCQVCGAVQVDGCGRR